MRKIERLPADTGETITIIYSSNFHQRNVMDRAFPSSFYQLSSNPKFVYKSRPPRKHFIPTIMTWAELRAVRRWRGGGNGKPAISGRGHGLCAYCHCNLIMVAIAMGAIKRSAALLLLLFLVAYMPQDVSARRGKGMKRTRSKTAMTLNTGKFLDKDSHNYYNHKDGAKIISASHFDLEFTLGHKIKFVCTATGNPLPSITWFKDGIEIFAHAYTTVHEHVIEKNKTFNDTRIISKLEIDPAAQMDAGIYECSADNKYSIDRRSFKTDFSIVFD